MKSYVEMGTYYRHEPNNILVRTVCTATHSNTNERMIGYVHVGRGGCASEVFVMPEIEFKKLFLH